MDEQVKKDLIQKLKESKSLTVRTKANGERVPYLTPVNFAILWTELNEVKAVLIAILEN